MFKPALTTRRAVTFAREGAMQCPRCSYRLSHSDALLCRVGETHYCPRCWSRIPEAEFLAAATVVKPHAEATNGADTDGNDKSGKRGSTEK